jgi:hypothetical protein
MDNLVLPRDADPSEMTDFEKNATYGELQQLDTPPADVAVAQEKPRPERDSPRPDNKPRS